MSNKLIERVGHNIVTFVIFAYGREPVLMLWCHTNESCHDRLGELLEEMFDTGYICDWPDTITMASVLIKDFDTIEVLPVEMMMRIERGRVKVPMYILPPGIKSVSELSPIEILNVPIEEREYNGYKPVDLDEEAWFSIGMYIRYHWPEWRNLKGVLL